MLSPTDKSTYHISLRDKKGDKQLTNASFLFETKISDWGKLLSGFVTQKIEVV